MIHVTWSRYAARAAAIVALGFVAACPESISDPTYDLTITPSRADLWVPDSLRFSASLEDQSGTSIATQFVWSVSNPSVASIDSTGLLRTAKAGDVVVTVTARGQTATANVSVDVDSGQTITISPTAANLFIDGTQRFAVAVLDRNGDTLPATPQWRSTNPDVATVTASGLVRGVSIGSATIEAKARGLTATAGVTVSVRPASAVMVGAGDIAGCTYNGDELTAQLIDNIPGLVFTAGDNAYPDATAEQYAQCYEPTWGRHKARTRPAAGNHEYHTFAAAAYFDYFGSAAGDRTKGYYSYDHGAWHIIVLNSNLLMTPGSPQEVWLREDLAQNQVRCTLAIWHHPRFSSGMHGNAVVTQPLWQALYEANADVVITGHDHHYERFAPQTATGEVDMQRGLRQFIVGTGGTSLRSLGTPVPNSEVRNNTSRGVLKLNLYSDRYEWSFVPIRGATFTDGGSASCH